jgi:Flp pilus assembly pilin Flp
VRNKFFFFSLRKLWRNRKGVTALEFGLLAPAFFLLFLGLLEVCLIMTKVILSENAIRIAGRQAIVSSNTEQQIQNIITRNTFGFINFERPGNCVVISAYSNIANYKRRKKSTGCNDKVAGDVGVGEPKAILSYELFFDHQFFTPLGVLMNMAARVSSNNDFDNLQFSTSTIVQNEPYGNPEDEEGTEPQS